MIGQVAVGFLDPHVVDPGRQHHRFGRLAASQAAARGNLGILIVGAGDLELGVQGEAEDENEEKPEQTGRQKGEGQRGGHGIKRKTREAGDVATEREKPTP